MEIQMTIQRREAYVELLEVLKRVDSNLVNKIPKGLMEFFERNKSQEYMYIYNDEKTLKEQNLNNITLSLLAMLNLNYWCENEEYKKELIAKYNENDKRYQEELREKYNPDNIFKNNKEGNEEVENVIQNEVALVEYKEPIFRKLINKIKSFFHIN